MGPHSSPLLVGVGANGPNVRFRVRWATVRPPSRSGANDVSVRSFAFASSPCLSPFLGFPRWGGWPGFFDMPSLFMFVFRLCLSPLWDLRVGVKYLACGAFRSLPAFAGAGLAPRICGSCCSFVFGHHLHLLGWVWHPAFAVLAIHSFSAATCIR